MSSPYDVPMPMLMQPLPSQVYLQPYVRPITLSQQPQPSKVYMHFVSQPMGMKPVEALAGIGAIYGKKLHDAGFDLADQVFGKFLELKRDEESFKRWLWGLTQVNRMYGSNCYSCLNEWGNNNFF